MQSRPSQAPTAVQYLLHHLWPYCRDVFRKYWFRTMLFVLVGAAYMRKDLSVQVISQEGIPPEQPNAVSVAATSKVLPPMNVSLLQRRKQNTEERVVSTSNTDHSTATIAPLTVDKQALQEAYLTRYAAIAQKEMRRYGIPASITLAQGLLESNAGQSPLVKAANNHFGIKCFSKRCYKGHCKNYSDDSHKDFFRVYPNAWESYRAHSLFLKAPRYEPLFRLGKKDYRRWARGLAKAGYATDPGYGEKLIQVIERFELYRYD